jgi:hypothetical protein
MQILLKNLLKEVENPEEQNPLKVQIYCDMDGVLVDMDKGFKKLSGGVAVNDFRNQPEFHGDKKLAQKKFWRLVNTPNFWIDLEPTPDAKVLWKFISDNFKEPAPVILSAGSGASLVKQKTDWIRKYISPTAKVIISATGLRKPEYIIEQPMTSHVLIDDTQANIDAWNNTEKHRVGILHKDAASTISQLQAYIEK